MLLLDRHRHLRQHQRHRQQMGFLNDSERHQDLKSALYTCKLKYRNS
jgi:hypothetical protein